jgi:hypothetical protein
MDGRNRLAQQPSDFAKETHAMSRTSLPALALALAAFLCGSQAALAADIPSNDGDRYGSPYDDPRYDDIYRHPTPPRHAEPRYEPPRHYQPAPDYRHYPERDRHGYLAPMQRRPGWRDEDRRYSRDTHECAPRHEVRRRLTGDGWSDFQDAELDGDTAIVRARRPSGRQFELRIDRCSGDILEARPLIRSERAYSWRDRPTYRAY